MIVCSCHAISDSVLRKLVHAGASLEDVQRLTAAGTSCGCCRSAVRELVEAEKGGCDKATPCAGCTRRAAA